MSKIIVTGGAGYIGLVTATILKQNGFIPIIVDNFCTSQKRTLPFETIEVDLADWSATEQAFSKVGSISGVIHFAALALVGESISEPEKFLRNNLQATLNVAQACIKLGCQTLVHSSSCTMYDAPKAQPISELNAIRSVSPYGESKILAERILSQMVQHRGLKVLNLRYFNPAGAIHVDGQWIGENHSPETHLIPLTVKAGLEGGAISIFGSDYDTADGTCVRDFIHIEDLAHAHIAALNFLAAQSESFEDAINLGAGTPVSVLEVIHATEALLGAKITAISAGRRPGDPPYLLADITKAKKLLDWRPERTLDQIIGSHIDFARNSLS